MHFRILVRLSFLIMFCSQAYGHRLAAYWAYKFYLPMDAFCSPSPLIHPPLNGPLRSMPRWDNSRARPLVLDLSFPALRGNLPGAGVRGRVTIASGGRGSRQRGRRPATEPEASPAGPEWESMDDFAALQPSAGNRPRELGDVGGDGYDGGLVLIDDSLGETMEAFPSMASAAAGGRGGGAARMDAGRPRGPSAGVRGTMLGGAWGGQGDRPTAATLEEEFPTLAAAAAVAGPSGPTSSRPWGGVGPSSQDPFNPQPHQQLRKATSRCPCGRRAMHFALRDGDRPPPLACDRDCELQVRGADPGW